MERETDRSFPEAYPMDYENSICLYREDDEYYGYNDDELSSDNREYDDYWRGIDEDEYMERLHFG